MKVSVIITTYNSMRYLPDFIDSIFEQSYFNEHKITPDIFIVDNASTDGTVKFIKDHYPTVYLLRNMNIISLSRTWNQAIRITQGEYILIMNPDLILHQDFIKVAVKVMQADQTVASVGGKLYQLKLVTFDNDITTGILEKTNIIDSCGLQAFKNRSFAERGAGEVDQGQYNQTQEIFGISGACVMYRRQALEQIKYNDEYFDENFFLYKEDIDMAWRLRLAGWSSIYTPQAIAYHHRRARSLKDKSFLKVIKYRRRKESFVNFYSYRNHLLLLRKNIIYQNFFAHFIYICFYELKKILYVLILENSTWRHALKDLIKFNNNNRKKRQLNMRLRKVKVGEMQAWFE